MKSAFLKIVFLEKFFKLNFKSIINVIIILSRNSNYDNTFFIIFCIIYYFLVLVIHSNNKFIKSMDVINKSSLLYDKIYFSFWINKRDYSMHILHLISSFTWFTSYPKYNINRILIKSLHTIYLIHYHYSLESNEKQDQDTWKRFAKYFTTDRQSLIIITFHNQFTESFQEDTNDERKWKKKWQTLVITVESNYKLLKIYKSRMPGIFIGHSPIAYQHHDGLLPMDKISSREKKIDSKRRAIHSRITITIRQPTVRV